MKRNLNSIFVLTGICLVVALLMSLVNSITSPVIQKHKQEETAKLYADILPNATELVDVEFDKEKYPSVSKVSKDSGGAGFVFELISNNGYTGKDIIFLMSVDSEGKIIKLNFSQYPETRGSAEGFVNLYTGKTIPLTDNLGGATLSSGAIKGAVSEAFEILSAHVTIEVSDIVTASPLFAKVMPYAVTKSGDIGYKEIELPKDAPASITGIVTPSTGVGYIMTAKSDDELLVVGVNAYGKVFYLSDLDGNDLLNNEAYAQVVADAQSIESTYKKNHSALTEKMVSKDIVSSADDVTEADFSSISSNVSAVYKLDSGTAYIATVNGYGGLITVCYVIDSDGNIVKYATLEENEVDEHYSGNDYGKAIGFKSYASRFDEKTVGTITDDTLIISGATSTSTAAKKAWNDIKAAHEALLQEVE